LSSYISFSTVALQRNGRRRETRLLLPSSSFDPYIFDGESAEQQQQQHDGDADGIRAGGIYLYTIWVGWGGWESKGLAI
jgi:hypothetical protein